MSFVAASFATFVVEGLVSCAVVCFVFGRVAGFVAEFAIVIAQFAAVSSVGIVESASLLVVGFVVEGVAVVRFPRTVGGAAVACLVVMAACAVVALALVAVSTTFVVVFADA